MKQEISEERLKQALKCFSECVVDELGGETIVSAQFLHHWVIAVGQDLDPEDLDISKSTLDARYFLTAMKITQAKNKSAGKYTNSWFDQVEAAYFKLKEEIIRRSVNCGNWFYLEPCKNESTSNSTSTSYFFRVVPIEGSVQESEEGSTTTEKIRLNWVTPSPHKLRGIFENLLFGPKTLLTMMLVFAALFWFWLQTLKHLGAHGWSGVLAWLFLGLITAGPFLILFWAWANVLQHKLVKAPFWKVLLRPDFKYPLLRVTEFKKAEPYEIPTSRVEFGTYKNKCPLCPKALNASLYPVYGDGKYRNKMILICDNDPQYHRYSIRHTEGEGHLIRDE